MSKKKANLRNRMTDTGPALDDVLYDGGELPDTFVSDIDTRVETLLTENAELKNKVEAAQGQSNALGYSLVMSDVGLSIDVDLSLEQWAEVGVNIRNQSDKIQWVIGDWMLYGEQHWSHLDSTEGKNITSVYDIAEQITGYSRRSLWRFKNVSQFFNGEDFLRRKSVPYSIHANAYEGIPEAYRAQIINDLLLEAEREEWTVAKLTQVINEMKQPKLITPEADEKPALLNKRNRNVFNRVWRNVNQGKAIKRKDLQQLELWVQALKDYDNIE